MSAFDRQEGGDHYKHLAIQPAEYSIRNRLGFAEGAVVKYVTRWRAKGGVDDLRKARHFIDLLIECEATDAEIDGAADHWDSVSLYHAAARERGVRAGMIPPLNETEERWRREGPREWDELDTVRGSDGSQV